MGDLEVLGGFRGLLGVIRDYKGLLGVMGWLWDGYGMVKVKYVRKQEKVLG